MEEELFADKKVLIILIIQEDDDAKYIDIGFLLKGETLILAQCKKCLGREPKNYIIFSKHILIVK